MDSSQRQEAVEGEARSEEENEEGDGENEWIDILDEENEEPILEKVEKGKENIIDNNVLGCSHYERNCKIIAPCCNEAFWCRHCHNEAKADSQKNPKLAHEIDRKKVVEVVCGFCEIRQPVDSKCKNCSVVFAKYFCDICKFWDNKGDEKKNIPLRSL